MNLREKFGRKGEAIQKSSLDALVGRFLQLNLTDYLWSHFHGLEESDLFKTALQRIPDIASQEAQEEFIRALPKEKELEALVISQIETEYSKIQGRIEEIEEQRARALAEPKLDYVSLYRDFASAVTTRLNVNMPNREVKSKAELEEQISFFVNLISEDLEYKLKTIGPNGFKLGDKIKVSRAMGFDLEGDTPYFYSGDVDDVPIGSVGELKSLDSPERITIRINRARDTIDWIFHPDELKRTGKNIYDSMVSKYGSVKIAAESIVAEVLEEVREKHLDLARRNINEVFSERVSRVARDLITKFRLSDEQMAVLEKKGKLQYALPPVEMRFHADRLYPELADFTRSTFNYSLDAFFATPRGINSEKKFRDYVASLLRDMDAKDGDENSEKTLNLAKKLLEKQYAVMQRIKSVLPSKRLESTLKFLNQKNNEVAVKRKMMYNDGTLFVREPFAPPSESHDHVIILQAEYGCTHKCTYCTGNETVLTVRKPEEFEKHVKAVRKKLAGDFYSIRRVFIDGGNFFRHSAKEISQYLEVVKSEFPGRTQRIAAYTRTEGLLNKTLDDLAMIQRRGLNLVYWGVETGSDRLLEWVNKRTSFDEMAKAGDKVRQSGLKLSVMLMPGLGGLRFYEDHVKRTADLMNVIRPAYITFLTINPEPHAKYNQIMAQEIAAGTNMPLTDEMVVEQMYDMVNLMETNYNCLVGSYMAPNDRVGKNPIEFTTRWQNGDKSRVLKQMRDYFTLYERTPSPLLPETSFNKNSPLRKLAKN